MKSIQFYMRMVQIIGLPIPVDSQLNDEPTKSNNER